MHSPWLRLLTALTVITVGFGAYRLGATPVLEPPRRAEFDDSDATAANPLRVVERMPELARWFPADAWELDYPQLLETEHGMLMLQSYETLEDGRLLIEPCTMVLKTSTDDTSVDAPIILQAPAGAILSFDKPLDLRKASVGKLVGGLLQGEIHIHRASTADSPALDLRTRNVQIDPTRIWTTQQVSFRYGQTTGSGSDLLITLPEMAPGAASRSRRTKTPIRFMELVHVDQIHVDLQSMLKNSSEPATKLKRLPNSGTSFQLPPPRSVDVMCDGPFRIDFLQQAAAFERNVRLTLHHDGPKVDQLRCEMLAAYFAMNEKLSPLGDTTSPSNKTSSDRFQLKRLVATGNPVTIDAPNYMAGGQAQRLEYDFEQRLLVLGDSNDVSLHHERFHVKARGGIEYQLPETGTLGELWAGGPGEFSGQLDPKSADRVVATWGQRFKIQRQGDQHLLSLEGGASVGMREFCGIQGQRLHVWLRQLPKKQAGSDEGKFALVPDRMLAEENVVIESASFRGELQRAEAWFRDAPARLPQIVNDPPGNLLGQQAFGRPADTPNADQPTRFFRLVGRQARLQVLRRNEEYEIDELTVEGGVDLSEVASASNRQPLHVNGQVLVMRSVQSSTATLQMIGNPAHLSANGVSLWGGELLVDRGAGTIDIPTAGHIQLPISADMSLMSFTSLGGSDRLQPISPQTLAAPAVSQPPQILDMTWQKECHFDGRTATFDDRVELRSGLQFASADALSLTLDRPIDFASNELDKLPQPQLETLRLDGRVSMEHREMDAAGQLTSIQRAALPWISVNQRTGEVASDGAGWFETVRYGDSFAEPGTGTRGRQPQAAKPPELIHLKVHYAQGIRGDLRTKSVRFFDQVQAIYGPIDNWQQRLDLWRPETHGEKSFIMRCDQLQAAAVSQPAAQQAFEMTAMGNTSIQGRTFLATCHRISYDGRKQLLVMEGDGRRDAEVTRQARPGAAQSQAAARQIFFSLRDQSFQVHDAKYIDLNGPFAGGGF